MTNRLKPGLQLLLLARAGRTFGERLTNRLKPGLQLLLLARAGRSLGENGCVGGNAAHAPGVWIVYFSLAALPLFGIGQAMAPSGNPDQRRSLFRLLVVYVASGLGLLLATSLLGLRRYLRQRRLQMPGPMAGLWVTIGVAMIVAILAFALLFPRPNPEYSLADLAPRWTSPPQQSSRYAVGRNGADQNRPDSPAVAKPQVDRPPSSVTAPKGKGAGAPGKDGEAQNQQGSDSRGKAEGQRGSDRQGKAQSRQGSDRQASDGREKSSGQEKAADSRNGPNQESPAEKGKEESESRRDDRRQEPDQQRNGEDSQKGSAEKANRPKDPGANRGSDRQTSSRSRNDNRSREAQSAKRENQDKSSENARSGSPSSAPPPSPPLPLSQAGSWFATLMKWISLAVLAFVVGWWLFRCWREVLAELRRILEELRTFWQGLFGGKRAPATSLSPAEASGRPALRPFAAFSDPFLTGAASQIGTEELVRYSFEALEAWGRQYDCPRNPEQTPHEFAQQIGRSADPLARDARVLADLYCRVAYASGTVGAAGIESLRRFWRVLSETTPATTPAENDWGNF